MPPAYHISLDRLFQRASISNAQQCVQSACDSVAERMHPSSEQFRGAIKLLKAAGDSIQSLYKLLYETPSLPQAVAKKRDTAKPMIDTANEQITNYLIPFLIWNNRGNFSPLQEALNHIEMLIFGHAKMTGTTGAEAIATLQNPHPQRTLNFDRKDASTMDFDMGTDVVIITALSKERDAVLRHLGSYRKVQTKGRIFYKASVRAQKSDNSYQIILLSLPAMGNLHAAVATQHAISVWNRN
jgi:hypothetical protein